MSIPKKVQAERGDSVEIICEARHIDIEVKWFKGREELSSGDRYSMKQCGYSHRLLIKDVQPADTGAVRAVIGSNEASTSVTVTGLLYC